MPKYTMTIEVEAEQFLPEEDKIPKGVTSDGPRSPKTDPRAKWVLLNEEGMTYLTSGCYIVRNGMNKIVVPQELFEENYKLVEG